MTTYRHEPTSVSMTERQDVLPETGTTTYSADVFSEAGQLCATTFKRIDGSQFRRYNIHVHDRPDALPVVHVRANVRPGEVEQREYVAVEVDDMINVFLPMNIATAISEALAALTVEAVAT